MPFKVSLNFSEEDSAVITVDALNLEKAIEKVAKMIEDKKVIVKPEGHYAKGYNLANVRHFPHFREIIIISHTHYELWLFIISKLYYRQSLSFTL